MGASIRFDPLTIFRFHVEIDGLVVGGFSDISGLQAETEIEEYREGGSNAYSYKFPKTTKYPNPTLKRGLTYSDVLWQWYLGVINGKTARKSGSIILLDAYGFEAWRWNFFQAYPVKWVGPELKAENNALAFETIELAHHGLVKS